MPGGVRPDTVRDREPSAGEIGTATDMNDETRRSGGAETLSSHAVFGAPCWVSLTTRDQDTAEEFYAAVLGWRWEDAGQLGEGFRMGFVEDTPVAGLAAVAGMWHTAVAWTPYFAVASADETVARASERGGTVAVGPLSLPPGRAALLADRDGAVFGIWEGELVANWLRWRRAAPAFVRLHARDAFDSAIFYGEVLEWASERSGCCEVRYESGEVVLRSEGEIVARIGSGAQGSAPDPVMRPHWQVHFTVDDVDTCAETAERHGGAVLRRGAGEALLRDPDGARFTVTTLPVR
jgi:predicted enzyme related to lactoylglutathione lyase